MAIFARPKIYLGIDVGTNSIKLLQLEKSNNDLYLSNYAELKSSSISGVFETRENLLNTPNSILTKLFLEVLNKAPFKAKRASISIPVYSTFSLIIEVPALEKKELEEAIKYEAQKHIPIMLSEMIIDWKMVDDFFEKESKLRKFKIFIMAVPKDIVEKYKEVTSSIGLDVDSLEVEIFSLRRATYLPNKEKLILMDIGGLNTNITFFEGYIIKKTVNLPFAGADFTRLLQSSLKISQDEADKLKIAQGLNNPKVKNLFYPLLNNINMKIEEMFSLDSSVEKIFLSGGSSFMPGLIDFYKEKLKNKIIEPLNPWKNIKYDKKLESILLKKSGSFGVVCGLALKINEIEF